MPPATGSPSPTQTPLANATPNPSAGATTSVTPTVSEAEAVEILRGRLTSRDAAERFDALLEISARRLTAMTNDVAGALRTERDTMNRRTAALVLGQLGGPIAQDALAEVARTETAPRDVRDAAELALDDLLAGGRRGR
jgi:hypothetical protein